ncbi:hypothetical protein OEZ86_003830 [Tetradesmus obliquus]|nr:hypothetical protein OEZ86_003830 [Tetradesmus obliquus]
MGPSDDDMDGPEGELHAVETAIRANALIFAAKLAVFFVSNSSAMLAEAVHSLVDIANQLLLRVGIMKAQKQPNEQHPYGYARDQFIWPLISAVGIFCCGAGVSFVHGVTGLLEAHREIGDLYWNFVVLGVSGVLESHSLMVAVNTLRRRAAHQGMSLLAYVKTGADPAAVAVMMEDGAAVAGLFIAGGCLALCQQGMSLLAYVKTGADPAAVAVMMEDGAAVAGLFIAGGCLALCQATGAVYWDAIGSIAVSALLGVVAVTLIQRNRKWLIGKSMPKAQEDTILDHLANDRVIRQVSNIKSEELGVRQYRFQADIAFDGEELARRALDRCGRTRLFKALDAAVRRHDPHALDALLMQFAAVIVSTTGAEVDRLEREIMRLVPGTRWVDLETDRGKPARLTGAVAAAAAAAQQAHQQHLQQQTAAAAALSSPGSSSSSSSSVWDLKDPSAREAASRLQFADWHAAESLSPEHRRRSSSSNSEGEAAAVIQQLYGTSQPPAAGSSSSSSSSKAAAAAAADAALDEEQWGEEEKRRLIHELHDLEDSVMGPEDVLYKPFCENMFQKLHPDQPRVLRSVQRRQQQQQRRQQQQQEQEEKLEGS